MVRLFGKVSRTCRSFNWFESQIHGVLLSLYHDKSMAVSRSRIPTAYDRFFFLDFQSPRYHEYAQKQADERVRIAVLDTGIDLDHLRIAKSKARIPICNSWVASDPFVGDTCGHGTHIAFVTLRMAPWAHLYVARVFKNGNEVDNAGAAAVAKAIDHARTEKEIDILSISFGYRNYMLEIFHETANA